MIDKANRVRGAVLKVLTSTLLAVLIASTALARQGQAPLQITAPTSGAIVSPGQTISVTVGSPAGLTFAQVDVIGEFPIGLSTSATSVPAQFSVTIPSIIACGPRMLTAQGTTTSGQNVESASIVIDVERADLPVSLTASTSALTFESQGQQDSFALFTAFSDGTVLRATESSHVTYASSNLAVATVNATGVVTAVASGNALITATYTLGSGTLQIPIPISVQLPILTASPSSLTFPSQGVGTTSSPQQVTLNNASGGTVNVLSVAATSDFSETDNCIASSPLGTNGSCTVNVTFSPTATGSTAGNLNITNSANIAPMSISLTGTGTSAPAVPNITSLSPNSGAVGTAVTITGTNFSSTQGASTITFNGTTAIPTTWTATSIVAPVPSGSTTGSVVVTVGGAASNGVNFTVQGTTNGIVLVQHAGKDAGTATSSSLAFSSNNAAGNWIAVCIRAGFSGRTFTVTDSKGNSYHQAVQRDDSLDAPNGNTLAIFYAENVNAGANTVTVSNTGSSTLRFAILEYSGVATVNSLDAVASAEGNSTSPNSGNATTTASGDLLLGAIATADPATFTAPSGFTIREFVPAEPSTKLVAEDKIQTTAGSAAATASLSGESDPWGAVLAAFKKAHP